jgi:hypothetical protein
MKVGVARTCALRLSKFILLLSICPFGSELTPLFGGPLTTILFLAFVYPSKEDPIFSTETL